MNRFKTLVKKPLNYIVPRMASLVRSGAVEREELLLLNQGKQLSNWVHGLGNIEQLEDAEFRIFSQFGDDGIIQYVISHLKGIPKTFIEFGVQDYNESNTRFLLINNNWSGFIIDGSHAHVETITSSYYYWRHELQAKPAFITAENINSLLSERAFAEVGILHIDLDGNDYWIWKAIDCINPPVVIVEYNSTFGQDRAVSVPYASDFQRSNAHYSNLYFGASLPAMNFLASEKGYQLIGCNGAGNNAYFVRSDIMNSYFTSLSVEQAYRRAKFREGRDESGALNYLSGDDRARVIKGMPVVNVTTDTLESL